jgi:hypothetical protein
MGAQVPDTIPLFGGLVFDVGFDSAPGGAVAVTPTGSGGDQAVAAASASAPVDSQTVLAYHVYCCVSGPNACDESGAPFDTPAQDASCDAYNSKKLARTCLIVHSAFNTMPWHCLLVYMSISARLSSFLICLYFLKPFNFLSDHVACSASHSLCCSQSASATPRVSARRTL